MQPFIESYFSRCISVKDRDDFADGPKVESESFESFDQFSLVNCAIMIDIDPTEDLSFGESVILDGDWKFADDFLDGYIFLSQGLFKVRVQLLVFGGEIIDVL